MREPLNPSPQLGCRQKFTKANRAMRAMVSTELERTPDRRHPTAKMIEGEMKAVDVSDDDLKALVAYIKSLK
jgi:hypothetical protein